MFSPTMKAVMGQKPPVMPNDFVAASGHDPSDPSKYDLNYMYFVGALSGGIWARPCMTG